MDEEEENEKEEGEQEKRGIIISQEEKMGVAAPCPKRVSLPTPKPSDLNSSNLSIELMENDSSKHNN